MDYDWGTPEVIRQVPTHMVNLDALIGRDDFTVSVDPEKNTP